MKTNFEIVTLVLILSAMTGKLSSQDPGSENQKKLCKYVGEWSCVMPDSSVLLWHIESTALNNGIYSKGVIKNDKGVFYQADALWLYDVEDKNISCYEIMSNKKHKIHKGNFLNDSTLYLAVYKNDSDDLFQESWLELKKENSTMNFRTKFYTENGITENTSTLKRN